MKDYSLNYEDSKTFILNYEIEDNQIILNLASGEDYPIPYTLENEKKILKRMRKQVLDSNEFYSKQAKKFSFTCVFTIHVVVMLVCNIIAFAIGIGIGKIEILNVIGFGWFAFITPYYVYNIIDSKRKIEDIEKNKMFLENEELINEKVKSNENILFGTKELVSSTPKDKPTLNLNDMDKIKYRELKKIVENIKRDEQFGFDYPSVQKEEPIQLTKKKKKDNKILGKDKN